MHAAVGGDRGVLSFSPHASDRFARLRRLVQISARSSLLNEVAAARTPSCHAPPLASG